mmetsp:Transcript_17988/g.39227  ORF Transcript_17988/g.39227 Transcript_17988/m.39227 type:complete len:571 (-) Transcript_17988:160-1872(-)|eukprot:CAMPEP_0168236128 /NCGR_PEP_ID=MMETSP0140_2-20121125/19345_1 /TAXON_ID=44445 /ORGANISM="Pseudo-nitzschia australis, Strain 10249 10 AB" /LENGTH=570 /DNA_ID=CAMNT_0008169389 /DNA_START=62 /DNA_END=1774 /DNA_ORIENTATION=+
MVGSVVVDVGTLTNTAIAAISTATGSSNTATTSIVAAAAAALAATATNGFAEEALADTVGKFRKRKVVPSIASSVTSKTANALALLRGGGGGGARGITKKASSVNKVVDSNIDNGPVTRGKSVAFMAVAMACHYLGYSFARPITIALFTSKATGYPDSPGAFPFAMAFVSPISLCLLLAYGSILQKRGPRGALERTTLYCASAVLGSSAVIEIAQRTNAVLWKTSIPLVKLVSGPLFVFRESYVQLLTSQYWSFMASVLTPNESAKWFAPIAGLTSIASVIGGTSVSFLSERLGLSGTLACTGLALLLSMFATGKAYSIAEKNGFCPKPRSKKVDVKKERGRKGEEYEEGSLLSKARNLFKRVPVLKALFWEIIASQSLATLLNVCFVASVGATIPDDTIRAGWVGKFYALINVFSMTLQFAVLPLLMQYIEPKDLWRFTPLISLGFTTFQAFQKNPALYAISASLLVMKVSEYSARRMLDEMVYVPLDFESRFLGKEIIGVFGYRFGKSCISLSLTALTSIFGQFDLQSLSVLADLAAMSWVKTAWNLSSLVPTKKEAQGSYDKASTKK